MYDTSVNACDSVNVGIYVYKILMKYEETDSSFLSTLKPTDKMLYLSQHCLLVACTSISMGNPSESFLHRLEPKVQPSD